MTSSEFLDKCDTLATENGFNLSKGETYKIKDYNVITYKIEFENKSPSIFRIRYDGIHPCITLSYDSVMYNYAPTGNISITTKHYSHIITNNNLDKFKWDVLEKWFKNQNGVKRLYIEGMKKKIIEKRIKKMEKDF